MIQRTTRRYQRLACAAAIGAAVLTVVACSSSSSSPASAGGASGGAGASAAGSSAAPAFVPTSNLDWVVASGAGGGSDLFSREIVKIIQQYKLYPKSIKVDDMSGGSGAVGWGYLYGQKGNSYALSVTSSGLFTTPLQAKTPWDESSFVPIASLDTDETIIAVSGKSSVSTLQEFVTAAQSKTPRICGEDPFSINYITAAPLAQQGNFKLNFIPFNDQGSLDTAMLSGNCDAIISNPSELTGLVSSGDIKVLAVTGSMSLQMGNKTIPSFSSAGFNVDIGEPRGIIMPPGTSAAVQQYWEGIVKKIVATPEWKAYVTTAVQVPQVLYGDDFAKYMADQKTTYSTAYTTLNGGK